MQPLKGNITLYCHKPANDDVKHNETHCWWGFWCVKQTLWDNVHIRTENSCVEFKSRNYLEMAHKLTAVTEEADSNRVSSRHTIRENANMNSKRNPDKSFEELVEESLRLPALSPSSHLPMTMTEILRNSQAPKDMHTKLPQIHGGQVQLVTRRDGTPIERKRRRGKKSKLHRPKRPSPRAAPDNTNSMRVSCAKQTAEIDAQTTTAAEQLHWKQKMHKRHSKRHLTGENADSVNVSITISGYQHYEEYRT